VPYVVLAWVVVGAGVLLYLRARHPERLAAVGQVLAEDAGPGLGEGGAVR